MCQKVKKCWDTLYWVYWIHYLQQKEIQRGLFAHYYQGQFSKASFRVSFRSSDLKRWCGNFFFFVVICLVHHLISLLKIESAAKWPKMAFSTPFSGEIQAEIGVESWAKQECIVAENLIFEFSRLFKLCLHFGSTASCADRLC